MLEIVYDLAPGADLGFATARGGRAQFAQNIRDLRTSGCEVIVDDVGYPTSPVFQDGIIADAVDAVGRMAHCISRPPGTRATSMMAPRACGKETSPACPSLLRR